jgi:hypothetical protein
MERLGPGGERFCQGTDRKRRIARVRGTHRRWMAQFNRRTRSRLMPRANCASADAASACDSHPPPPLASNPFEEARHAGFARRLEAVDPYGTSSRDPIGGDDSDHNPGTTVPGRDIVRENADDGRSTSAIPVAGRMETVRIRPFQCLTYSFGSLCAPRCIRACLTHGTPRIEWVNAAAVPGRSPKRVGQKC